MFSIPIRYMIVIKSVHISGSAHNYIIIIILNFLFIFCSHTKTIL